MTNFTRFLEFCKCQFGEAERFKKATMYNIASLMFMFIHGHQSTVQYFILLLTKDLE